MSEQTQIVGTAYLVTVQGICKIVEAVASFIAVLLVGIKWTGSIIQFFESAAAISIISAAFFLILYMSALIEKTTLSWSRIQFFFHSIFSLYYLIADILVFSYGIDYATLIAGGVFGLFAIVTHLVDAVDNYKKQPLWG